jgi:peptidoglycan/LPS O-acetylase OafA/YrhL
MSSESIAATRADESAILSPSTPARTGTGKPKRRYIDCLRGYAVFMVMVSHTVYAYTELPYPVHRLGTFGWFGVQLFFLASCLTLMGSSTYERDHIGKMQVGHFFIRRFLRIAPVYYAAGLFYLFAKSTEDASLAQALSTLLFVNAWHPTLMAPGGWQLVEGGWSIGVEFTFYFLFPLFFATITNMRRALTLFAVTVLIGASLNSLLIGPLTQQFGSTVADNFLFFWFFNQAPIFALGAVVFFIIKHLEARPDLARKVRAWSPAIMGVSLFLLLILSSAPIPFSHQLLLEPILPQFLMASFVFSIASIAMSQMPERFVVNRAVAGLGLVSFSAYLLHFAVIEWVLVKNPGIFHTGAIGYAAIAACGVGIIVVAAVTYLLSRFTYAVIELPAIQWAARLTRNRAAPAPAH